METAKIKKILIALDYDPSAQKVAEAGYDIAKSMNAEITLLHVISDPVYYASTEYSPIMGFNGVMDVGAERFDTVEGLKNAAQHFLNKTKKHLNDEDILTLVNEGEFAESILIAANLKHADIIVMGSHSRGWLENIIMGSVTEKVLKITTIPLLIIPIKKKDAK